MTEKGDILKKLIESDINIIEKNNEIHCLCCDYVIKNNKTHKLRIHLETKKHSNNNKTHNNMKYISIEEKSKFNYDLTKTLIESGIALNVVNKKPFINFFEKHFGKKLPCAFSLMGKYLNEIYQDKISKIRSEIMNKKLYFILDETRDKKRYIYKISKGSFWVPYY